MQQLIEKLEAKMYDKSIDAKYTDGLLMAIMEAGSMLTVERQQIEDAVTYGNSAIGYDPTEEMGSIYFTQKYGQ